MKSFFRALKPFNTFLFYLALLILVFSFFNRNIFVKPESLAVGLYDEPWQATTSKQPFRVEQGGQEYLVEPLYDYQLTGIVVSYRLHNPKYSFMHKAGNDHLNVADVCVVWKNNALALNLNQFDFWNGEFTCNIQTDSREAWNAFNMNELSNNHLLTDDPLIRQEIEKLNIGDQIQLSGWLSHYSTPEGYRRGTSTTRTDSGNGACETIFLKHFSVIQPMFNVWRFLLPWSGLMVLLTSVFYMTGVVKHYY
ncbi:MAG: hypothetical protein KDI30_00710 [Pseudomonadales bacterium]|nr:hypothetical protein [Pseudomonadales bacterium]